MLERLVSHELPVYLSVFDIFLIEWIMAILSKGHELENSESHSSLKLSFANFVE